MFFFNKKNFIEVNFLLGEPLWLSGKVMERENERKQRSLVRFPEARATFKK
jgi:hypothetical protein